MRIQEPTPQHLSLWTTPNWLLMVLGIIVIMLGTIAATVPGKATTLSISRTAPGAGACDITETTMFAVKRVVRIPLRMLRAAEVEPGLIGGKTAFYHLNLDVDDGKGEFYFAWYGNKDAASADAARINAFLASGTARSLTVQNDKRRFYFPFGGVLVFLGVVLLFWGSGSLRATFDREGSQVRIIRRGLLGTNLDAIPFHEIEDFHVAGISGDCQLFMKLSSGRKVLLTSSTDMQNMVGPRKIRAIRLEEADRLRDFCRRGPETPTG